MKRGKKVLALLLAVSMTLSLLTVGAAAADAEQDTMSTVEQQDSGSKDVPDDPEAGPAGDPAGEPVEGPAGEPVDAPEGNPVEDATYVAAIGEQSYETLQAAINAANAMEAPAVIELLGDIDLGADIVTMTISAGKNVTIDFKGFTITGAADSSKGLFVNLGVLTLKDSSGQKGGINCTGKTTGYGVINGDKKLGQTGTLILENIKIVSAGACVHNKAGSTATINGCEFSGKASLASLVNNGIIPTIADTKMTATNVAIKSQGADTTQTYIGSITNCTIHGEGGYALQVMSLIEKVEDSVLTSGDDRAVIQLSAAGTNAKPELHCLKETSVTASKGDAILLYGGTISIESGEYQAAPGKLAIANNAVAPSAVAVEISGGTFSSKVEETYLADGVVQNANGEVGELEQVAVAQIGGQYFETLKKASSQANDGDVIVVLDNISYVHNAEDWFVFNGSNLSGSKAVTVDLNGKTIEANGVDGVVYAINGAQITIDGSDNGSGIVAVGGFFNTAEYAMAVWSVGEGTKVIINGGRYTQRVSGNDSQYDMIYAADKAVIEILDGEFTSVTPKWTLNVKDDTAAQFLVKGGRFTQYNPAESTAENPTANFCAPGFVSVKDGANYIVISQDDAAVAEATLSDGSTGKYLTLQEAVDAAADGGTVTLLKNVDLGKNYINITKKLTLDLNGCTITGNNTWVVGVFSDVTIKDSSNGQGKIVNSATSGATIIAVLAQEKNQSDKTCKLTIEGGVITATGVENSYGVFSNNSDTEYGPTIIVNGGEIIGNAAGLTVTHDTDLTVSGGEITGKHYAVSGNGAADDTKITINGGKLVSTAGNVIYHPQVGDMTIGGNAELMGPNGVQYCGAGTLTIQDNAVITATGPYTEFPTKAPEQGDGSTDDGAALSIISRGSGYQDGDQKMTVNITGGTLTSANNAAISVYRLQNKNGWVTNEETALTSYLEKLNVTGGELSGGARKGVFEIDAEAANAVSVSGGYFTSDPGAYVAGNHYVVDSDKAGYSYKVTNEKPAEAPVIVTETVEASVPGNAQMNETDKATVTTLLESNPPAVSGVADALTENGENAILDAAGVTAEDKQNANKLIKIEIEAKVEAVQANLTNGELTFRVTPVATVTVGGTVKKSDLPVDNGCLGGKGITVKLPVPAEFEVQEIKHTSDTKGVEYFLNTGTNTFTVKDDYAELTIRHFSELKLSGSVTAAAMVDGTAYPTLQRAIDAAGSGDTITVLAGVDKAEKVTISGKSLTIELGETGYSADNIATGSRTEKVVTGTTVKITYSAPSSGGGSSSSGNYIVDVEDSKHGTITVSPKRADKGDTVTITVRPDKGYELDELTVTDKNGDAVKLKDKGDGKFTFTMPGSKVTVEASFKLIEAEPEAPAFVDVPAGAYYADAVAWAVEQGVTSGTSANTFSPDLSCTRAQMVTFLWRANGSPVVNYAMSFTDVSADAYYAEAVRWAVSEGITTGTSATTFSPDATVTRAQAVTFIYRNEQAQGGGFTGSWMFPCPFTDVPADAYYFESVQWCAMKGITSGTGADTFSPDAPCTRAQIVTFLYRDAK